MWDLALDGNTSGSGSLGKWPSKLQTSWASLVTQTVKNLPTMQKTQVRSLGWENPLEEEMATHSSILAGIVPWTEELGGGAWWAAVHGASKSQTQLSN